MYIGIIAVTVAVVALVVFLVRNSGGFGKVEGPTSQGAVDHFDMVVVYKGARADAMVVLGTLGTLGFDARLSEELRDSLFLTATVHPIQVSVPREQAVEAATALEEARELSLEDGEAEETPGN